MEKCDIREATDAIKAARETIAKFTTATTSSDASLKQLHSNDKELIKLLIMCKERRKNQLRKEKQRAQAMFGSAALSSTTSTLRSNEEFSSPAEEKKTDPPTSGATANPLPMPKRSSLKQSTHSSAGVVHSPQTEMATGENGDKGQKLPVTKKVSFADETKTDIDDDRELSWHQDPAFLGGLGVVIGVVGTLLVLSQFVGKPRH